MKTVIAITVAALLSGNAFGQAPSPPPPPIGGDVITETDTVKLKTRRFWVKNKGFLSENKIEFTESAQQMLTDFGKEIDKVAGKVMVAAPVYFLTRLQALRQQHQHLSLKLQELTGEAIKTRMSGPRFDFERCVASLEAAIEQADEEADVLAKMSSPEKLEARK